MAGLETRLEAPSRPVPRVRYRFGPFTLSPIRRTLLRGEHEVPLIPRYLDLLLLLVARRHEAVPKREIFDEVWSDVVVSDGALSQAIRTLRRALGDEAREPAFIRTVSRHGYRFVHPNVIEELEGQTETRMAGSRAPGTATGREPLAEGGAADRPPLALGRAGSASAFAAVAGLAGGTVGGLLLRWAAGWDVQATVPVVLGLVGASAGALGGLGVGLGLTAAEAYGRGRRLVALPLFAAIGGAAVGFVAHRLGRWTLEGLFGRDLPAVGGGFEGLGLGLAVGLGLALAAPPPHGSGARAAARARAAVVAGLLTAAAAVGLAAAGGLLAGASINAIARAFQGSQVGLAPLARLLGEPDFGPLTRAVLSAWEGLLFGAGVVLGFTRRR